MLLKQVLLAFVVITILCLVPAQAKIEKLEGMLSGLAVTDMDKDLNPVITAKKIKYSYEHSKDWKMECGRYLMNGVIRELRNGQYSKLEKARILGQIDELRIIKADIRNLIKMKPDARFDVKKRILTVQFTVQPKQSGAEYCNLKALEDVNQLFKQWSQRDQAAAAPEIALDGDSRADDSSVEINRNSKVEEDLNKLMDEVLEINTPKCETCAGNQP